MIDENGGGGISISKLTSFDSAGDLVETCDEEFGVNYNAFDEDEDGDEDVVAGDLVEACDEERDVAV